MKAKKETFFTRLPLHYVRVITILLILISANAGVFSQPDNRAETVTISVSEKFSTLDTLTAMASDAAAERIRDLMFNSLVKKDEKFDYVGDLAREIKTSEDGKTVIFVLRDNVKFHNGKVLTAADVKYTFGELFKSNSYKSGAFFETVGGKKVAHIISIEIPNTNTVNFVLSRASLKNQFLLNLVSVPIVPEGSIARQNTKPTGTGPFKFVRFDEEQNIIEFQANPDYFEGAPTVKNLCVKTVTDAASLETELQSGAVDVAPITYNLPPDVLQSLERNPKLKVEQFDGANIDYLGFNTKSPVLKKVKIRQAIAYGIDRQRIISELLLGRAKIAYSVLPRNSWAYFEGTKYNFNPELAKQLLRESGYKNEPIRLKISAGNAAVIQYVQVIQDSLRAIGLNVEIEVLEANVLRKQITFGEFQMNAGRWVNGNQDPIFLKDLFWSGSIPGEKLTCCNRSRYSNPVFDKIIEQAINNNDRERAKILYAEAQKIVSVDLPLLPLWYPANTVVSNKRIGNVKINQSGDWRFVKDLKVVN
jgi:peptide/nickel transport system substrate-binding protein